ncbi:hypothetical protein OG216_40925 [Streptomycetaceae bacterium NBC_01309]
MLRALLVALLMLVTLAGGTFPAQAEPTVVTASDAAAAAAGEAVACPYQAQGPNDTRGCGSAAQVCASSTVPPVPPVLPVPVGPFSLPWFVGPDGSGPALARAPSAVATNLAELCVSRT